MRINPAALKHLREFAGHTQLSLAAESGVSQQRLSELEAGTAEVRPATAKRLAEALRVPISALLVSLVEEGAA